TEKISPVARLKRVPSWLWTAGIVLVVYAIISTIMLNARPDMEVQLRLSLGPLVVAPTIVQVHVAGALLAFLVGLILLVLPKGVGLHKLLGWTWVAAIVVTAGSSFFMTGLMGQYYSPIHALSAWVMLTLPFGIAAIRRGDVGKHRKAMTGMFLGGLLVAGLFSFLPGRLMWQMFFTGG
ncbi:MAG: DUF2306 domain-containing protein, partial [Henriciella sp.]|nr:DUF2306 domain-containing protein [Henriciella sp.]